ncbi:Rieske (2Fe-2S) protein [Cytophagaceae bacterium ABcell3]|nr:Rieske (2Fe-2S) protein [Cytophagaceae bacterium ABcell3]
MAYKPKEKKEPHWKRDFPIRQDDATKITRREFAKFLCLLSGGFAAGNGFILANYFVNGKEPVKDHFVCNVQDVPAGEMIEFSLTGVRGTREIPYILVHLEDGQWRAFDQKCTHLACAVRYVKERNQIQCPCHNGWFNAETGDVIQGPPPRALPQLKVTIRDEKVFVSHFSEHENNS